MRVPSQGIVLGIVLLALLAGSVPAQRASFSGSPSSRAAGSPGGGAASRNRSVLRGQHRPGFGQDDRWTATGQSLRMLRASRDGKTLFGVYAGENRIYVWNEANGVVQTILDAPRRSRRHRRTRYRPSRPRRTCRRRIAFWDLRAGRPPSSSRTLRQCWKVRFIGAPSRE